MVNTWLSEHRPGRDAIVTLAVSPFAGVGAAFLLDALGVEPAYVWNGVAWAAVVALAFLVARPRRPWRARVIGVSAGLVALLATWAYLIIALINCDGCLS